MVAEVDHAAGITASLEPDLTGRVRLVAVGLPLLAIVMGGLTLLEWPRAALLGAAFTLGSTQIAGY